MKFEIEYFWWFYLFCYRVKKAFTTNPINFCYWQVLLSKDFYHYRNLFECFFDDLQFHCFPSWKNQLNMHESQQINFSILFKLLINQTWNILEVYIINYFNDELFESFSLIYEPDVKLHVTCIFFAAVATIWRGNWSC